MAAKEKTAKSHKPGHLEVTATVTAADGASYTVCGCSVEEVRAAVEELKAAPQPAGETPTDIRAEG